MAAKTLRVRAKGDALVPNLDAFDAGVRRYIGWQFGEVTPGSGEYGFTKLAEAVEVSARMEHVRDVKEGMLEAADADTAKFCGVGAPLAAKKGSE